MDAMRSNDNRLKKQNEYMETNYSSEKGIQILVSLLKAHGIKRIITSPGGTNMMLNASLMHDGSFEMFSSVDERSAAYMACGMAEESGEPVVLTCTGATASRNYMPALTEAFYRKLPVLVVTGTQDLRRLGNLYDQVTDRSVHSNDILTFSTYIPTVRDEKDSANVALRINQAISALTLHGGGPSHINLETIYSKDLSVKELPNVKVVNRIDYNDKFPSLPEGKIAIFIGAHRAFTQEETEMIDAFCERYDAVCFCDHTSGYKGHFRQIDALLAVQHAPCLQDVRLLIHLGEVSGDHFNMGKKAQEVWRINEDGQLRDRFGTLTHVFAMKDITFFERYVKGKSGRFDSFLQSCKSDYRRCLEAIPELPFSNIWMAKQLSGRIPQGSVIHFGILTSLRSWNFFEIPQSVTSACNVGGFGTDGTLSSLLGAALVHPDKLYFGVLGDLAFFYDMNALGNRHWTKNIRILLVNNGKGCEFTHHLNPGHIFKEDVNPFIAAAGHFGCQSRTLVRDYSTNLGMEYLTASTKDEFMANMDRFLCPEINKPILFEVFTQDVNENEALRLMTRVGGFLGDMKHVLKEKMEAVIGEKRVEFIKRKLR